MSGEIVWQGEESARFVVFPDLVALREAVAAMPEVSRSTRVGNPGEWSGSADLAEALQIASGDTAWSVAHRVERMLQQVEPLLQRVERRRVAQVPSVAGGAPNVARHLSGDPRCMRRPVRREVIAPRRTVRVELNRGASASVSAETLEANGALVFALCESLRRAGYAVDLWATNSARSIRGDREVTISCQIAHGGRGSFDMHAVAYALAHPSYHRRLVFALREALWGGEGGNYRSQSTPGYVAEVLAPTIAIDLVSLERVRDHTGWIVERLRSCGVEIA